ncbi:MAG: GTP-binding protein [Acidimicrobiia bacterium]|nr:GTP-binding protein [Acidimicrobiia bacterium]
MPDAGAGPTPVTIVGGFLGAGKTSLLNHILSSAVDRRIAVLVNDFGTINIDAKLIVSVEGETVSLANGCVCCTIRDDLLIEVEKLLATENPPEHIVIETSGVSKPLGVAETFTNPSVERFVDVRIIAVLDADLTQDEQAEYCDLAFDHILYADLVVINKTDLVTPPQLASLKQRVEAIAGRSRIWETTYGEVPLDLILDDQPSHAMAEVQDHHGKSAMSHGHNHGHDRQFDTWTLSSDEEWSFNALQRAVENLPRDIYRAKGTVRLDLETRDYGILQVTGRRGTLRLREPDGPNGESPKTEIVFIGKQGSTSEDGLRELFDRSLEDARNQGEEGYLIKDLRSFNVVFV